MIPLRRILADPYKLAAMAYLTYGLVYLTGAVWEIQADPARKVTFWGVVPWWAFYVAGAGILVTLPVYLWREIRWLALTLAFFTAVKALTLCWIQGRHISAGQEQSLYNWVFAVIAATTSILLLRASRSPKKTQT